MAWPSHGGANGRQQCRCHQQRVSSLWPANAGRRWCTYVNFYKDLEQKREYWETQACIAMSENSVHRERSRHLDVSRYYVEENLIKLMLCCTKEMTADALTNSEPAVSLIQNAQKYNAQCTSQQKMLKTTSLCVSACWTWTWKRRFATGEPLDVSEDGGALYIHVCICRDGGHTEYAPDTVARLGSVETSKCARTP